MKLFTTMATRAKYGLGRIIRECGLALDARGSQLTKDIAYLEPLSRHRTIMPLYDSRPVTVETAFIAPNASIIGEVLIGKQCSIWYGATLRGDLNAIRIGYYTSIGDNAFIHTAHSLPTGIPASVNIGNFVTVQHGCALYSCIIDDYCLIGFKSIILEGAKIERGAVIGPNSVVPPGRLIPAGQLWAGNPVEYVRDLTQEEIQAQIRKEEEFAQFSLEHKAEIYEPHYVFSTMDEELRGKQAKSLGQ